MVKARGVFSAIQEESNIEVERFFIKRFLQKNTFSYRKNGLVYAQGDAADTIVYLQSGMVSVNIPSKEGKNAVLAILKTGEFFGYECLAGKSKRLSTVVAMADCRLVKIRISALWNLLYRSPKFSKLFISYLARRNNEIEADLSDQLLNTSEKRLARRLLLIAKSRAKERSVVGGARITQQVLAEMIGTTQSRISYFISKFRRSGLIEYDDHLVVNKPLLEAFLND